MSSIINIIEEELESLYSANFPEFGERLHTLNEIEEELESLIEYGEATLPPYPFTFDNISYNEVNYNFDTEDGDDYIVMFNLADRIKRIWELQFGVVGGKPSDVINKGRRDKVMSTIVKIVNDFINRFKPNYIKFEPSKNDEYEETHGKLDTRRFDMYMAYIKNNMRPDYIVFPHKPYIVIERKVKILDKNLVTV